MFFAWLCDSLDWLEKFWELKKLLLVFEVVVQFLNSSWWNICLDREPYTLAWLVKRVVLTSSYHWNMIRNLTGWIKAYRWDIRKNLLVFYGNKDTNKENFMDLYDTSTDPWCSKVASGIINIRNPIFHALEKGLKSKIRRVS